MSWCNSEYDRLISDVAPTVKSHAERMTVFGQAEQILMDELPVIPIYIYTSVNLVNKSVKNYADNILNQPAFTEMSLQPEQSNIDGAQY